MKDGRRALVYLGGHNEVDHISPIIYKIGERGKITADVVLESGVSPDDYRIQAIDQYDNVNIHKKKVEKSQPSTVDRVVELTKKVGRKLPTQVPKKIYKKIFKYSNQSCNQLVIPNKFSDHEYDVIAFDWTKAKSEKTTQFADDDKLTTVVLPHGDSPFINAAENKTHFNRFLEDDSIFGRSIKRGEVRYRAYEKMLKHDYALFPNKLTASRIPQDTSECQIEILGSPRYNDEWISVLDKIRPTNNIEDGNKKNIVFFLRRKDYFISKYEVKSTVKILERLDDVGVVVKEHPRSRLLPPSTSDEMESTKIVKDEISSASLVDWGDIFLSLGTTITFEPIMKKKPVLSVEYAHSNYTVVSDYFPRADMRTKDDLYHTIRSLLEGGMKKFYDNHEHKKFREEMISPTEKPVLDSWAEFIESKCW